MRMLAELGLYDALAKVSVEPRETCFFNRHGQLIHTEPLGRAAGYNWPQFSIHRGDLHEALLAAVHERLGADAVQMGRRCIRIDQDEAGVRIHWQGPRGEELPATRATVAIACDGVHSTVRRQFYPDEGEFAFGGINMWRGSTRYRPILTGRSVILAGALSFGKLVIYPMRDYGDGTHLINWNVEVHSEIAGPNQWNKNGRIEDFLWRFEHSRFDWLDVRDLDAARRHGARISDGRPRSDRALDLRPGHLDGRRRASDVSAQRQRRGAVDRRCRGAGALSQDNRSGGGAQGLRGGTAGEGEQHRPRRPLAPARPHHRDGGGAQRRRAVRAARGRDRHAASCAPSSSASSASLAPTSRR